MDLLQFITLSNPIYIPLPPIIISNNNSVLSIFEDNTQAYILHNIAINNQNYSDLIFYTNGLVSDITTEQYKMEIG